MRYASFRARKTLNHRVRIIMKKAQSIRRCCATTIVILLLVGILMLEMVLFFEPVPDYDYYYSDENSELLISHTKEEECRALFKLIDSSGDELITLEELKAFALYRFHNYDNSSTSALTLDEFGQPEVPMEKTIFKDAFLGAFDANKNGVLDSKELTINVANVLYQKAEQEMAKYDTDDDAFVTWNEFFELKSLPTLQS